MGLAQIVDTNSQLPQYQTLATVKAITNTQH